MNDQSCEINIPSINIMKTIRSIAKTVKRMEPKNLGKEYSCIIIKPTVSTIPVRIIATIDNPDSNALDGDVII